MGTCYSVMIEARYDGDASWDGYVFFNLGKTYEFARAFPHRGWPRDDKHGFRAYDVSQASRVFYEKEFADTNLAWGTLEEVEAAYEKELAPYPEELHGTVDALRALARKGGLLQDVPAQEDASQLRDDDDKPRDFPIVRAVLAAARALRDSGIEVRLLLWGD